MTLLDIKAALEIAAEERRLATEPRPIETAPMDGTRILGHDRNGWHEMFYTRDTYDGAYWDDDEASEPTPTHWLPLPPKPHQARMSPEIRGWPIASHIPEDRRKFLHAPEAG